MAVGREVREGGCRARKDQSGVGGLERRVPDPPFIDFSVSGSSTCTSAFSIHRRHISHVGERKKRERSRNESQTTLLRARRRPPQDPDSVEVLERVPVNLEPLVSERFRNGESLVGVGFEELSDEVDGWKIGEGGKGRGQLDDDGLDPRDRREKNKRTRGLPIRPD